MGDLKKVIEIAVRLVIEVADWLMNKKKKKKQDEKKA